MPQIRLGEIGFINALPLALASDALAGVNIEKTVLSPTGLNQAMLENRLDISAVSSAFYLRHQEQFELMEEVSISAEQPVESVLLFLPEGFEGLTPDTPIAIPDSSETSIALMQYIIYCRAGFKLSDTMKVYSMGEGKEYLRQKIPLLAIGNEALTLKNRFGQENNNCVDLAEAWLSQMKIPFVFAVWIARKEWVQSNPELFQLINQLLIAQKHSFQRDLAVQFRIIAEARQHCPHLPEKLLRHYFTGALSYNLGEPHRMALTRFRKILEWLDHDTEYSLQRNCTELPIQLLHR